MLDHLQEACRIGVGLNARLLVFGSPRNRDRSGLPDEQTLDIAMAFFQRLAGIAGQHGVTISLEPNPQCYGSNFMTYSYETATVVNLVGHPAQKMQFDTGSLSINGENPPQCSVLNSTISLATSMPVIPSFCPSALVQQTTRNLPQLSESTSRMHPSQSKCLPLASTTPLPQWSRQFSAWLPAMAHHLMEP